MEGRLPVVDAMRVAQQLLAGLSHAHAQEIVHRDLKPENLMLSAEGGWRIICASWTSVSPSCATDRR